MATDPRRERGEERDPPGGLDPACASDRPGKPVPSSWAPSGGAPRVTTFVTPAASLASSSAAGAGCDDPARRRSSLATASPAMHAPRSASPASPAYSASVNARFAGGCSWPAGGGRALGAARMVRAAAAARTGAASATFRGIWKGPMTPPDARPFAGPPARAGAAPFAAFAFALGGCGLRGWGGSESTTWWSGGRFRILRLFRESGVPCSAGPPPPAISLPRRKRWPPPGCTSVEDCLGARFGPARDRSGGRWRSSCRRATTQGLQGPGKSSPAPSPSCWGAEGRRGRPEEGHHRNSGALLNPIQVDGLFGHSGTRFT